MIPSYAGALDPRLMALLALFERRQRVELGSSGVAERTPGVGGRTVARRRLPQVLERSVSVGGAA